jgi:hypothetical protein
MCLFTPLSEKDEDKNILWIKQRCYPLGLPHPEGIL